MKPLLYVFVPNNGTLADVQFNGSKSQMTYRAIWPFPRTTIAVWEGAHGLLFNDKSNVLAETVVQLLIDHFLKQKKDRESTAAYLAVYCVWGCMEIQFARKSDYNLLKVLVENSRA